MSLISAPFMISRPTVSSYFSLLKNIFLLDLLPAWHGNRSKRLIKTPKVHMTDTGVAAALLGATADQLNSDRTKLGHLLETYVYNELLRQASGLENGLSFYHFRDKDQYEVDIIIEEDCGDMFAVEVKAGATVFPKDFRGIKKMKTTVGSALKMGIVFYDGERVLSFGEDMYAVPISAL